MCMKHLEKFMQRSLWNYPVLRPKILQAPHTSIVSMGEEGTPHHNPQYELGGWGVPPVLAWQALEICGKS